VLGDALPVEEQQTRFRMLEKWFLSESGSCVMQAFLDELKPIQDLMHGDTLLQFGSCGSRSFTHELRFSHKWTVTPYERGSSSLITCFNQLPIDRDSIDCVIAPLILEAFSNKHNLINEIDRVLKPMGYVVFFGINPLSLWGLWLRISKNNCFGDPLLKPKSVLSVKLAMIHRGYVQCHLSSFYYIPPVRTKKWIDTLEIMNEVGKMISPVPSGFYCLVVQKQQENFIPLIPITPKEQYVSPAIPPLQPT
jgi:hypothetical protein